ncbi:hypothetical protein AB205_0180960, partial [Aquarana catesbeiana]
MTSLLSLLIKHRADRRGEEDSGRSHDITLISNNKTQTLSLLISRHQMPSRVFLPGRPVVVSPSRCLHLPLQPRETNGSSNGNPPERCPRPLYSWDSTQEDHTIPHHHQHEEQMYVKVEVKEEEEEVCVMDYKQSTEEFGMTANIKREESVNIITDGSSNENPPERCPRPLYSQDSTQEDHTIPDQDDDQIYIKVEIKEEETDEMDDQPCVENAIPPERNT